MAVAETPSQPAPPEYSQLLGHPRPLWMLFMSEFWERFAFYGIRWALVLYIVAQFYGGRGEGQQPAGFIYGSYLALVYAGAIFGGYVADKYIGYQRSILVGAVFMAIGLFMISIPNQEIFKLGLATIVVGNGMFKPIISTIVGRIYAPGDERRDSGFTIFYMGINLGAMLAPLITQYLARKVFGSETMPAYKVVFLASAAGMIISTVWFWLGRKQLKGVGGPPPGGESPKRILIVALGALVVIPVVYFLLAIGAERLQLLLTVMFIVLAVMLVLEGIRNGPVARDKVIAMMIIFAFNILFWMFFEQAGSSFTFLADEIVNRDIFPPGWLQNMVYTLGGERVFPTAWFQSVNSVAIITLAPVTAWIWVKLGRWNPSIPRKFGMGLIFNGLAFLLLMFALSKLVDPVTNKIPFWTLFAVYWIQSIGELCLSPIGLSMVTKLAPVRLVGFGMGGWFLSTGIGNNLSGIFAGHVSGSEGMTTASALAGYTFGFYALVGAGLLLFLLAPLIQKLMHGVK
ncbi:MAG: oligopeptide:H+ symporter [Acidobacteriota bacterium]|nr:oligopeptide:H+ symporter [Blastocatellia bacterium]MDW8411203.1 oligopeptide:H+ symporter [Acidobacteriota bacterium]